ncbi:uncharacterized protein LOC122384461 [Amphibalanus amphitrite]|uniref:uncharacterized protein LOC122384461 n=1 Tax=Amphibalanus amphitrite TaxID=1232801 RepID=UPI001C926502|nr:uncharacterized protein LOC122384461 [Amphibalanus amphitrite]
MARGQSLLPLVGLLLSLLGGAAAVPPAAGEQPREATSLVIHPPLAAPSIVPSSGVSPPALTPPSLPVAPGSGEAPPPPGPGSALSPVPYQPAPPGLPPPVEPVVRTTQTSATSRRKRAVDSRRAKAVGDKSEEVGKKASDDDDERSLSPRDDDPVPAVEPPAPASLRLPQDVELLPGFSAPPDFDEPPPSEDDKDETNDTSSADGPTDGGAEHVNFEGLYYTTYADNNTHQEIHTPLADLATSSHSCRVVRSVPAAVRRQLGLSHFYQRYTEAYGIPVLSSARVPDAALRRACYIVRFLFADVRAVRDSYRRRRGRVAVIGRAERTTQIPEHSSLGPAWDGRARGLGATDSAPVCTIGEENLLNYGYPADRWHTEDIGLHEFAHGLHLLGARYALPDWERRLEAAHRAALRRGLWTNTYAATNHIEYFAEGVQKYHNVEAYSQHPNGIHNHVSTRRALLQYDPTLHQLVAEIFPCGNTYISRRQGGFQAASDSARLKLEYPSCRLEGSTTQPSPTQRPTEGTTRAPARRTTTARPPGVACTDGHHYCSSWARAGYCRSNAGYMTVHCRRSCGVCGQCADRNGHCADWARRGECTANPGYMLQSCQRSCRVC